MKTPSHDLYLLIKSLSKTEKRYFKKFSELHGKEDNKYLLLFDAISKQKEFDEEDLKKQFKGEAFLKQLPVAKNYLYSRILDALEFYHRDSSVHSSVRRNIYRAELLQKKGMYDQSMKPLKKAREDALEMDLFHAMIEINTHWEFNAYIEKYDLKKLDQLHADALHTSELLSDSVSCRNLSLKMVTLYNKYFLTRNKKYLAEAGELMKSPLLKRGDEIKSFSGRIRIYETRFFYYYAIGNLDAACAEGEKAVKLCLSSSLQMKNNIKFYIVLLSNLFYLRSEQKKFSSAHLHLLQMEKALPYVQTYSQHAKYFYNHDNTLVYYLYNTAKLKELEKKLPSIIAEFEKYKAELSGFEQIAMLSYVAISFFYMGNLKMCLHYLNMLRNEYDLNENPEAQYFLNIFYLIAHYDSGHHEILPYLVQSFHRFLRKKDYVSKVESAMVHLLKRLPGSGNEKRSVEEFKEIKKEIENLPHDNAHHYIFKYFDLSSWLESKMRNVSFQEVIKEKRPD